SAGLFVAFTILLGGNAFADSIVIRSGYGFAEWDGSSAAMHLKGNGTNIIFDSSANTMGGFHAGEPVTMHSMFRPDTGIYDWRDVTIRGTVYQHVFLFGLFDLIADPFVAPTAPHGTYMDFSTPFRMTG